jgi:hypothetical protein
MKWQFHFSRPVNVDIFTVSLARLQADCQQYDPFVLMTGIQSAFREEMGIVMKASVLPEITEEVRHEIQGIWGRN